MKCLNSYGHVCASSVRIIIGHGPDIFDMISGVISGAAGFYGELPEAQRANLHLILVAKCSIAHIASKFGQQVAPLHKYQLISRRWKLNKSPGWLRSIPVLCVPNHSEDQVTRPGI